MPFPNYNDKEAFPAVTKKKLTINLILLQRGLISVFHSNLHKTCSPPNMMISLSAIHLYSSLRKNETIKEKEICYKIYRY